MKQFFAILCCLFLTASTVFAQPKKTTVKAAQKASGVGATEISELEWAEITKALLLENWARSALLSVNALKKLSTENGKKQMANLRYFYLYSLAGKVHARAMSFGEFKRISSAFLGREFLMPSRQIAADCTGKVNFICQVANDVMTLRATATNKSANTIHFFEYYSMTKFFDVFGNNRKTAFLRGKLRKVESEVRNNIRVIRLFFEGCEVEIVKPNLVRDQARLSQE